MLRRNLLIYSGGGILIPFPGIKIIDMILVALRPRVRAIGND